MHTHSFLQRLCLGLAIHYITDVLALPVGQGINSTVSSSSPYLNSSTVSNTTVTTTVDWALNAAKKPKTPAGKKPAKTTLKATVKTPVKTTAKAPVKTSTAKALTKTTAKAAAPTTAKTTAKTRASTTTRNPFSIPSYIPYIPIVVPSNISGLLTGRAVADTPNPFIPVEQIAVQATSPEDGSLDGPDNLRLRLVVPMPPTAEMPPLVNNTVFLNGQEWYITELFKTPENAATFPNYTAISYRWYSGRLPNPFFDGFLMSNLTQPSLASAMRNSEQQAFWIDCFSIPATAPLKGVVLDLLSNIFSAAHEVIVPLGVQSRDTLPILTNGTDLAALPVSTLESVMSDLNQEEWVNSIWTYKESLSAKSYIFTDRDMISFDVASNASEPRADETAFFTQLATLQHYYGEAAGLNDFDMREKMRNVDALVELGLDRQLNAAYERSVFTSMASLDRRFVESPGNFFWGLYGSITEELLPADLPHDTLAEKYDRLFEICAAKNDYSFIYTSTARSNVTGKTFYPESGQIHSILNWPTSADYQTANVTADGTIALNGMVSLTAQTAIGATGKSFIDSWFQTNVPNITANGTDASTAEKVHSIISLLDYKGSDQPIFTEDGIFFPQQALPTDSNATILVASQLGWSFGAPGLAMVGTSYIPGAFVGSVLETKATSVVMK